MTSSVHPVVAEVHAQRCCVPGHGVVPGQLHYPEVAVDPGVKIRLRAAPD